MENHCGTWVREVRGGVNTDDCRDEGDEGEEDQQEPAQGVRNSMSTCHQTPVEYPRDLPPLLADDLLPLLLLKLLLHDDTTEVLPVVLPVFLRFHFGRLHILGDFLPQSGRGFDRLLHHGPRLLVLRLLVAVLLRVTHLPLQLGVDHVDPGRVVVVLVLHDDVVRPLPGREPRRPVQTPLGVGPLDGVFTLLLGLLVGPQELHLPAEWLAAMVPQLVLDVVRVRLVPYTGAGGGGVRCQVSGVRCQVSGVMCQLSGVRCQVSCVRCQVSCVMCQVSQLGKSSTQFTD